MMRLFLIRLQRGTTVLIALILAFYVASYLLVAGFGLFGGDGLGAPADVIAKSLVVAIPVMVVAGTLAAIPALILIVLAETQEWRVWSVHLLAGGAVGGMTGLAAAGGGPVVATMFAGSAAGAAGGLVYWALAGRKAGIARQRGAKQDSTTPPGDVSPNGPA
jgi:hypothetical protein